MAVQILGRTQNGKVTGPLTSDASWVGHHLVVLRLIAICVLEETSAENFYFQVMHGANLTETTNFSAPAADVLEMVESLTDRAFPMCINSNHGRLAAVRWLLSEITAAPPSLSYLSVRLEGFSSQVGRILASYIEPGTSRGIWSVGQTSDIFWLLEQAMRIARKYNDSLNEQDLSLLEQVRLHFSSLTEERGYAIRGH